MPLDHPRPAAVRPTVRRAHHWRRLSATLLSLTMIALTLAAPALVASPARADTAPPESSLPSTVSSDPLPTVQIDGVVWTQVVVGNTVYVGGDFDNARPAGAAPGTQTVPRANLLAYDITTGALLPFAPNPNAEVRSLAASPDGARLFVGGQFTKMGTVTRNRVAAFTVATGALVTSFAASTNSTVLGMAATETTLYLSGSFTTTLGNTRTGVSAVDAVSGALRPWAPVRSTSGTVRQIVVSPDRSKVILGGNFTTMNGSSNPGYGLAATDAVTGTQVLPLPVNARVRNGQTSSAILSLSANADGFYGSGYVYNKSQGNLEGAFKADWDGNLVWLEDCHGDSYSVYGGTDSVYVAGHPHYCGNVGGFGQTDPTWTFNRGLAFSQSVATPLISKDPYGYANWEGTKRPHLLHWFPDINTGAFTGQDQGPWHVTGNADYVVYGGEFTAVNGVPQQGLVRFAKPALAPDDDGPRLTGASFVPTIRSFAQGLRISWRANHDRDNEQLTYTLLRNGTPVGSPVTKRSSFWQRPVLSYLDTAVSAGASYSYRVRVTDPHGNEVTGNAVSATASGGAALSSYDKAVLNDDPQAYWPLGETSGTTAADLAGTDDATRNPGVTPGVAGAIAGDGTAYRFDGTSNGYLGSSTSGTGIDIFSVEAWFRTTTTTGGKIVGFGRAASGSSTGYDRQIYMNNAGRIYFGTNRAAIKTVSTTTAYNNGQWHHAVGTVGPDGMSLYLDGQLVASRTDAVNAGVYPGFWRIGGDALSNWPGNPPSPYLAGDIDQVAVYPEVLPGAEVESHHALRTGGGGANAAPSASFTSSANGLTASVDGSASSDSDGSITGYAWDFGDGGSGSGPTVAHTYQSAGTYPVTLTVTDSGGATGSTTKNVTVTAPQTDAPFVSDDFNRTLATGLGSADIGGAWTLLGGAASEFAVGDGAGLFKLSAPSVTRSAYLGATLRTSADTTLAFSSDKTPVGGPTYLSVLGRRVSSTADYRTDIKLNTNGSVVVSLSGLQGTTSPVNLPGAAVTLPGPLAAGEQVKVRMQTFGTSPTTVRARVWLGSAAEPVGWTVSATDSYAGSQLAGSVGFRANLSGSATNAPRTISLLTVVSRPVSQ